MHVTQNELDDVICKLAGIFRRELDKLLKLIFRKLNRVDIYDLIALAALILSDLKPDKRRYAFFDADISQIVLGSIELDRCNAVFTVAYGDLYHWLAVGSIGLGNRRYDHISVVSA